MSAKVIVTVVAVLVLLAADLGYAAGWYDTSQQALPIDRPLEGVTVVPATERAVPVPE